MEKKDDESKRLEIGMISKNFQSMNINFSDDIEKLTNDLCIDIKNQLDLGLQVKDNLFIVLSGGNTPKKLYEKLSTHNIDWSRIHLALTDERCVPVNTHKSNEFMLKNHLLKNNAKTANFHSLIDLAESHSSRNQNFFDIYPKNNPIDLLLLGVGEDGHTASLFSESANLASSLDKNNKELYTRLKLSGESHDRITLNYSLLSKSRERYLFFKGKRKIEIIERALKSDNPMKYPILKFLKMPIKIFFTL